ncbi:hypothetical protein KSP35_20710 [Aquihabitans sp. G128]|uniref:hypothetical protein n=1 Tax=Aquihabitans sp. G128 TaxID=2849779 RepID=UPI001C217110|nr:hypothetical protein [Aquihabitans sp. G128]QXC60714.1 hypothetical protein KSP35_20710 [Aquihabitans sp. G128]
MKIPTPAEQRQTYLAQLQPHVAEPILAVGFLATPGYTAGLMKDYGIGKTIGMVSPLAGWLFRKKKVADRLAVSRNDLVAVTASSVHLFEFPKESHQFVVTGPPTVWNRNDIRVTAEAPQKLAQLIHVQFRDGRVLDYDISIGIREWKTFSDAMRDLLLAPVNA